jgi:cytidine deaminase
MLIRGFFDQTSCLGLIFLSVLVTAKSAYECEPCLGCRQVCPSIYTYLEVFVVDKNKLGV